MIFCKEKRIRNGDISISVPFTIFANALEIFILICFKFNFQQKFAGIRYSEELSLKRFIPPELLRKGLGFEADQAGPQPIRPGEVFIC